MKSYPTQFSRLPYYKDLPIAHLFDAMHIGKNVTETLWKILDRGRDKKNWSKFVMTLMNPIIHCSFPLNQIAMETGLI